ncbi:SDR family NAD(P)-dependent oxidoreductase [Mycobacterium sp. MYCO198283]|uniref:SDR family NAD(P)-dependent oxidoreductase n=1 Tax=Mycobacterium sp. MYCO198283 TaxID=2883505 RepID=UPI001E288F67|nr:SDR family NAD(P)-dependent oxidoreductase [Mycobacterium sp. MYCO198283]MCG5432404.1 SDR family NAD(P)-dependent oxidoreductase [Mycobacterium sp. MYCO198283]
MTAKKWTAADVPDQTGRVAVITGANTGIGLAAAAVLAARGAHVVLAVRNLEKGQAAIDRITADAPHADVALQQLDLTSLESVSDAADDLRARYRYIDLLINNAGVMMTRKQQTKDGFELQFGTNHLGHFALTGQLLDNLLPVEGSRVVTISSRAHRGGRMRFDDLQSTHSYSRTRAYGQSKLANLLFTYELSRRLTEKGAPTIAVAAHPGVVSTELTRSLPFRPLVDLIWDRVSQGPDQGALPTLRAATDPQVRSGQYYGPDGLAEFRGYPVVVDSTARSHDADAQRRLWQVSEELTGVVYPV